jgi:hypothetical protein
MLIIDPYLFNRDAVNGETEVQQVARLIRQLRSIEAIRQTMRWEVVVEATSWQRIERQLIGALPTPVGDPTLRTAIANFRRHLNRKVPREKISGRAWGVKTLFHGLTSDEDRLFSRFVVESAAIARGLSETVAIFVEERFGRNAKKSGTPQSWISEKTHWRLYASISGSPPFAIPCITCLRNVEIPWTTRVDLNLPDVGTYRYEPIPNWESGRVNCVATMKSKKVWLDFGGNGWARPSTDGEPEHWDVYIEDARLRRKVNLDQINVTRHGVRSPKNIPGEIHHVPEVKRHAAKA